MVGFVSNDSFRVQLVCEVSASTFLCTVNAEESYAYTYLYF